MTRVKLWLVFLLFAAIARAQSVTEAAAGTTQAASSTVTASAVKPDVPVLTLTLKKGRVAEVTLVTYRGQRAFRFPVEHLHRHHGPFSEPLGECAGSLYVMADRMVFDAGLNSRPDRDPFDLPRSKIKEARSIPRSNRSWGVIRVVVGKKRYDFMPYFSNTLLPLAHIEPDLGPVERAIYDATGAGADERPLPIAAVQMWKIGTAGRPMLDAFTNVILDFPGTVAQAESGHYTPKLHKESERNEKQTSGEDPVQ